MTRTTACISFIRRGKNPDDVILAVLNATPVVRYGYRLGVPRAGHYEESAEHRCRNLRRLQCGHLAA